jgi:hypothetical protein
MEIAVKLILRETALIFDDNDVIFRGNATSFRNIFVIYHQALEEFVYPWRLWLSGTESCCRMKNISLVQTPLSFNLDLIFPLHAKAF